jgi:hypothetical protein
MITYDPETEEIGKFQVKFINKFPACPIEEYQMIIIENGPSN